MPTTSPVILVTSCGLSVVVARCLQVLEELQKVKDHCKEHERNNDTLHTELETLQQQLKVNILLAVVIE